MGTRWTPPLPGHPAGLRPGQAGETFAESSLQFEESGEYLSYHRLLPGRDLSDR